MQLRARPHRSSNRTRAKVQRHMVANSAGKDAAAQVKEKIDLAVQQVQVSQDKILKKRQEGQQEAEQRQKDQRFQRVKGALDLKEKGHKLEPTAGHDQTEGSLGDSKEAQTRENANSKEAQVPDPSISKSVRQRLLALEELRAAKPFRRLISRGEPVPQLTHHYAAAAWWAVS